MILVAGAREMPSSGVQVGLKSPGFVLLRLTVEQGKAREPCDQIAWFSVHRERAKLFDSRPRSERAAGLLLLSEIPRGPYERPGADRTVRALRQVEKPLCGCSILAMIKLEGFTGGEHALINHRGRRRLGKVPQPCLRGKGHQPRFDQYGPARTTARRQRSEGPRSSSGIAVQKGPEPLAYFVHALQ